MPPSTPTPTALIADDAPVARAAITRRLRAASVAWVEAASAAEATAVDPSSVGCALLDLDLGDGTGVDVALALRRARPELPIAFFSAGAAPDVVTRARAIGPIFRKPDDLDAAEAWVVAHAR